MDSVPERQPSELAIAAGIFILSFTYLCVFRRFTMMEPDEGILLQGAQRILQGQILYRDFFSFFTPGSYYLLAFLFKLFGSSFLVARTALVFVGAVYSVFTYLVARRVCSRSSSLFAAAVVTATTLPYRFFVLHNWDSTLWACLALYCSLRLIDRASWKWSFAAGTFASLTFLFEQSKGAGLILGLVTGFMIIRFLKLRALSDYHLSASLVGFALPFIITVVYFGSRHSLREMIADWTWPLAHYSTANRVTYGYQGWSEATRHALFASGPWLARVFYAITFSPALWIPLLPLLAIALLIYWIGRTRRSNEQSPKSVYYILTCASLGGLLLSIVLVRADIIHFIYLQPGCCLVLAWVVDGRDIPGEWFRKARLFLVVCFAVSLGMFSLPLLMRAARAPYEISTRRGRVKMTAKNAVLDYVQVRVKPGETVFVYPYLPLYYFLTNTQNPTRYEYFQLGMNTAEQANEILADLKSKRPGTVLFESSFPLKIPTSWPGTPLREVANDPISDYILEQYKTCKVLHSPEQWQFLFMARNDMPCR